ncbi:MAG: hypothetical protein PVI28_12950 [Gammaproteobacteria bacterium]|jgi:hypothetical protein
MHLKIRSFIAALLLMVSPLVLISKANAQSLAEFGAPLPILLNAHVSERSILNYAVEFPHQSGETSPRRGVEDVLITYEIRGVNADGNLVAEFSEEVPVNGFGEMNISVDQRLEGDILVINGTDQGQIPLIGDRISLRLTILTSAKGRNPATGESIAIPARKIITNMTVVAADGTTRSTSTSEPDGYIDHFQVIHTSPQ